MKEAALFVLLVIVVALAANAVSGTKPVDVQGIRTYSGWHVPR